MTTAESYWVAEYALKAGSDNAYVQSGRSGAVDPIAFGHTVRRILTLLRLDREHALLDVGCGNGLIDIVLSAQCARLVAVERVPELVALARRHLADCANVEVVHADGAEYESVFDRVLIWEAVQLMMPAEALRLFGEVARALRSDGWVIVGSIPNLRCREQFLDAYLPGVQRATHLSAVEKRRIVERNERATWYDPDELIAFWRDAGLSAVVVTPCNGEESERFHLVARRMCG